MTLWRKRSDAWATMSAAAPRSNIRADILEKDYWNSQVLRTASASHPTDFVFKGGTSLSKAYKCTQRFSEDIDVLILRRELGSGARDKLMKKIVDGAVEELELTLDPSKHSHGRGEHLTESLRYPGQVTGAATLSPDVLLEMGIRGSDEPPHDPPDRTTDHGSSSRSELRSGRVRGSRSFHGAGAAPRKDAGGESDDAPFEGHEWNVE